MSKPKKICFLIIASLLTIIPADTSFAGASGKVPLYDVHEITLLGPTYGSGDSPTRQIDLVTKWRHESGQPSYQIYGFWDGDGKGGLSGGIFKVRFCPTKVGKWTLIETKSNKPELHGQREGYSIVCT
ncbi:unnamed protein product, partial [marine sediment metagenome]